MTVFKSNGKISRILRQRHLRANDYNEGFGDPHPSGSFALKRSLVARALLASAALVAAVALAGCDTDGTNPAISAKALKPVSPKILAEMAQKNMSKDSPILIRLS
jgi:hypothetical protein